MSAEGLIDEIRSRGYWRINFRPATPEDRIEGVTAARNIALRSAVSLRGWDFPHMPPRVGDGDYVQNLADCFQAGTAWGDKRELWRIYVSSQFLFLRGVRTDWAKEGAAIFGGTTSHPDNVLGVVDNVWTIAEAFEFLSRLNRAGLYGHGAEVSIQLRNTAGRMLYVDESRRASFFPPRRTDAPNIEYHGQFTQSEIAEPKPLTVKAAQFVFDKFGWEAPSDMLNEMTNELYGLNIGRG